MNKFRLTIKLLVMAIFMFAFASLAQAQATRTWVSGVGDDANPCSRTAPCKTFAGAISKTAKDGEIDALDPGGFGALTINKSITIEGTTTGEASILNSLTTGITINITDGADVRKAVTIRGLSIQGAGTGTRGINIVAALAVFVENSFISGQNGSPGHGIDDNRAGGGQLEINNVTIQNCNGSGINVNPSSGSTQINVHINNSRFQRNATGFFAGSNVRATIYNSVFTQNTTAGVSAQQTAGGTTDVNCDHCMVSNNVNGFAANTSGSIIRVSNTTALNNQANNAGLAVTAGGGLVSGYGNNQTGGVAFPSTPTGQTE
jgi:Right handed beta helix region